MKIENINIDEVKTYENNNNDYLRQQIDESEANLRKAVRVFFENYKSYNQG